jgi:hypothetical protein
MQICKTVDFLRKVVLVHSDVNVTVVVTTLDKRFGAEWSLAEFVKEN